MTYCLRGWPTGHEVDLYLDGLAGGTRKGEMRAKSGSRVLPQIYISGKYLEGGFGEFMRLNECGGLMGYSGPQLALSRRGFASSWNLLRMVTYGN